MRVKEIIDRTKTPNTRASLWEDLKALGLMPGATVIVHSSLSSLGWVCGGPVAVIQALQDAVTPDGTLVLPAHSGDYSDPAQWENPPVPAEWIPLIRDTMPAYEPETAPTSGIGVIPEVFRHFPAVRRSAHPSLSFCAWGRDAAGIVDHHSLDYALGEESPLARIYDRDGWVLLLGAGYNSNTSFHLAEYRAAGAAPCPAGAPVRVDGKRVWREYREIEMDADIFAAIGADFERAETVRRGRVGQADSRLFQQRAAVDFATAWLNEHRRDGKNNGK